MIYRAAGDLPTSKTGADAPAALDWAGASNLNTCWRRKDVDAAFDRNEAHAR
jgi:hypothetical protein